MKSCFLLLCGTVCLVQANHHNQHSGLKSQARGKDLASRLSVSPAIKKPPGGGGQASKKASGLVMKDLGDMDNSELSSTGMSMLKVPGHKTAVTASFESPGARRNMWNGYTKVDGRKYPGNLEINGIPNAGGMAVHSAEAKARAYGPSAGDGVRWSKVMAVAPRTQISAKIEPGGLAKVYTQKDDGVEELVDEIHGSGGKQIRHQVSENGRHMTTTAFLLRGGPGDSITAKAFAQR